MTLFAAGLLVVVVIGAFFALQQARSSAQFHFDGNVQETATYNKTQKDAQEFRDNLATAKQILDKEVRYTSLLMKISSTIPPGVVLDSLTLDQSMIGKPMTLSAHARDNSSVLKLKKSLEKNSKVFSDVHFQSIQYPSESAETTYPITVTVNVTIKKEAVNER